MDVYDFTFPYYGKLENDDEVYISCVYRPVVSDPFIQFEDLSYIPGEKNYRLSFLSYLPLRVSSNSDMLYYYPTKSAMEKKVAFDLLFTPSSQVASVFKVKNVCNNSFQLYFNDNPIYISSNLFQLTDYSSQFNSQFDVEGNMFTLTKPNDQDSPFLIKTKNYDYATFYGVFHDLNFNFKPIYKKACILSQCNCTEDNCCIPIDTSSLSINSLCDFQNNALSSFDYLLLIIPKKSRYISFSGSIIEDNLTINNFLFSFDTIVNNNSTAPYVNYAPSLFQSLEKSKKTFNISYCQNKQLCGDNGCYGSCNVSCISSTTTCNNLSSLSECSEIKDDNIVPKPGEESEINTLTIITIIFAVILSIAIVVFFIIIFSKSRKKISVKSTYNVNIYEKEEQL